ncbi:MOSC domain-containing protein [Kocuria palustris]|uniref:MOSC domain-containing protein n=1 Tax=Kocuria palustris TaxID=71999 RepID=UPI0006AA41D5|nr:MOSC domain-containing protein [Kocuria palustris]
MARLERIGSTLVKGLGWSAHAQIGVSIGGLDDDRRWTPVWADELTCLRAPQFPAMVRHAVTQADLPADDEHVVHPETRIRYYDRRIPARVHDGPLAQRLSTEAGRRVLLARTLFSDAIVWGAPVSVLLRSELAGLPSDTDRYRPNLVIDDRDAPLALAAGSHLQVGAVTLEVVGELERCVIIDHDPITGQKDHSLLRRIRPGALLAYGCMVVTEGELAVGDPVRAMLAA